MKLSDRAILVSVRISQWTGTATEKDGARAIEQANGAKAGVVSARKILMPDFPELEAAHKFNTAFRNWFNSVTLEYQDSQRLLVVTSAQERLHEIGRKIEEGEVLADAVSTAYPDHLDKVEEKLGALFDRTLYPSMTEIRKKFGYRMNTATVPDTDTLRNFPGFDQGEVDSIVAKAEEAMKEQVNASLRDVYQRIFDVTNAMAQKLAVPIEQKGGIFRDSLVHNMRDLSDLLPSLNLFGDASIDQLAKELKSMSGLAPEALRTDAGVRAERAERARKLAEVAKSFLQ